MKYGLSEKQLNELLAIVTSQPEVEQVVLFGSRALGTYRAPLKTPHFKA